MNGHQKDMFLKEISLRAPIYANSSWVDSHQIWEDLYDHFTRMRISILIMSKIFI